MYGRLLRGLLLVAGGAAAGCGRSAPASTSGTVLASEIIGSVVPCSAGLAHPNVCCRGGACVTRPDAPFAACAAGALTFPDRRRCCPLDGGVCVGAQVDDVGADAAGDSRCTLPCGPEGRSSDDPRFPACGNVSGAGVACTYCCSGLGCPGNSCSCPALPDGGVCDCHAPECGACPSGWNTAAAQVDLCCASPIRCFSQSREVGAPEESGTFGGPDGCESTQVARGHLRDLKCSTSTSSCACSLDGTTTMRFGFTTGDCDLMRCGFSP